MQGLEEIVLQRAAELAGMIHSLAEVARLEVCEKGLAVEDHPAALAKFNRLSHCYQLAENVALNLTPTGETA